VSGTTVNLQRFKLKFRYIASCAKCIKIFILCKDTIFLTNQVQILDLKTVLFQTGAQDRDQAAVG
jgi:hypothetical protein